MYGYELAESLDQRTDGVLAMGHSTLYPLLYSLEAKGMVQAEWREADSGRRRKYYGLTPRGEAALAAKADEWRRLIAALSSLGLLNPDAAEA
jgi:PadR family transcriptional regulator PadR